MTFSPVATKPQGSWPFPRACAETGRSAIEPHTVAVALHASTASMLGCSDKAVLLATCNKLGLFQAS